MTDLPAYPPDAAICRLLAAGPAATVTLAVRLSVPERTVRHRLYRLRQAGTVVTGPDGLHSLATPSPATGAAGPLPAPAAPAKATDQPASDGSIPRHGGHARARTVLATAALGLAVAGGIAVMVRLRRMSPPPPPAPPSGFGNASDPWGSMRGPTW